MGSEVGRGQPDLGFRRPFSGSNVTWTSGHVWRQKNDCGGHGGDRSARVGAARSRAPVCGGHHSPIFSVFKKQKSKLAVPPKTTGKEEKKGHSIPKPQKGNRQVAFSEKVT